MKPICCRCVRRSVEENRRIRDGTFFPEGIDFQQVCLNGHQITDSYNNHPELRKKFCPKCGKPTITKCPQCKSSIPGHHYTKGVQVLINTPVPSHCHNCGEPYPWTSSNTNVEKITIYDILNDYFYKEEVQNLCQKSNLKYNGLKEELAKQLVENQGYSVYDYLNFLNKDSLKDLSEDLGEYRSGSKKDLIERIYPHIEQPVDIKDVEKVQRKISHATNIKGHILKKTQNGNTNYSWMNKFYFEILKEMKKHQDINGNYLLVPMNQIVNDMIKHGTATSEMKGDIKQSITSMCQQYGILDFGGHGDYRLNQKGHTLYFQFREKYNNKLVKRVKEPKNGKINNLVKKHLCEIIIGSIIAIIGTVIGGIILYILLQSI